MAYLVKTCLQHETFLGLMVLAAQTFQNPLIKDYASYIYIYIYIYIYMDR